MPFQADDFYVGMIAFFTVNDLRRQRGIRSTARTFDKKPRPFICYAEADGLSYWTCFTSTPKPWRSTIDRRWLRHPVGRFGFTMSFRDLIVSEGRDSYVGAVRAFARCSHKHDRFDGMYRPVLLREGVAQVCAIVHRCGGWLPGTDAAAAVEAMPTPVLAAA